MNAAVAVLIVDDDEDDYVLTRDLFTQLSASQFTVDWCSDYVSATEAMRANSHDIYLLDYRLGPRTGLELLHDARAGGCEAPVILLTGQDDHDIDLRAMAAGASDFLVKGRLEPAMLERSVRYSLQQSQATRALRDAREALETRVAERTAELETANAQLREADRRKDQFLAILAHELRNPLAPIANAVQILSMPNLEAAEQTWARVVIGRQVKHLTRLVDDLLDVSRINSGKINLRREWVDVVTVIERAIETSRPLIDARRHELRIAVPDEPGTIEADPMRISQVIANLLNNAAKYTDPGGVIQLSVERAPDSIRFSVADNGIGIAPDQLARVFEMFNQANSALERSQDGLGIGLALVRGLVEMHGGTVEAASAGLGHGTCFTVTLPVSPLATVSPTVTEVSIPEPVRSTPHRILVVDDNQDAAQSLAKILEMSGHAVRLAFDGRAAVETAAEFKPTVAFLDIGLPELNGYEAASQIRQSGSRDMLLVAVTGWGQDEDKRRAFRAGFDYHMTKPIDVDMLYDLIEQTPS